MNRKIVFLGILIGTVILMVFLAQRGTDAGSTKPLVEERDIRPKNVSEQSWNRILRVHEIKNALNKKIDFFGKVVDQDDKPVSGSKIELRILAYEKSIERMMETGIDKPLKTLQKITDKNGKFSVENEFGVSLRIVLIDKEGFSFPSQSEGEYFIYNHLTGGDEDIFHRPEKEHPVIFKMWKKGVAEPLIATSAWLDVKPSSGGNEVYFPFSVDGEPSTKPVLGWDVRITGIAYSGEDWEVHLLAPPGGGYLLAEGEFTNRAPLEGYKNKVSFSSKNLERKWESPKFRMFYRGPDGSKYAAFHLRFDIGGGRRDERKPLDFTVIMEGLKINPNGSRNLEFDPKKIIR
jgi:hypothetical protein